MAENNADSKNREDTGSVTTQSSHGIIHCITIIGTIEGHQEASETTKTTKYEHILPQLAAIEESEEIDGLLVLLNTVGGDVEAGLAIAELIAGMETPTVSLILGGSHSIGVPLAVAAKRTFIAASASMMLHPVRISGTVIGAPQTYAYFRQIQDRITRFIVRNSSVDEQTLSQLMMAAGELATDIGTVIGAEQAVDIGLCDQVGSLHDALDCLHGMIRTRKLAAEQANTPS